MASYRFAHDQRRYLATRALVRTTLSRYAAVSPESWRFVDNAWGRPAVSAIHGNASALGFNVSHTRGMIALGVTWNATLGVDIEDVAARAAPLEIADRFFSPAEAAALTALDPPLRQRRFFEYWTLKESYVKARGTGLSTPLDKFSFSYADPRGVAFAADPEVDPDAKRWTFWQLQLEPDYVVALCVEKRNGATPRLRLQEALRDDARPLARSDYGPQARAVNY